MMSADDPREGLGGWTQAFLTLLGAVTAIGLPTALAPLAVSLVYPGFRWEVAPQWWHLPAAGLLTVVTGLALTPFARRPWLETLLEVLVLAVVYDLLIGPVGAVAASVLLAQVICMLTEPLLDKALRQQQPSAQ